MNFHIKQNSTLPELIVEFELNSYRNFTQQDFYKRLQNSSITFSMQDSDKCYYSIKCKPAELIEIEDCIDKNCSPKFVIRYKFDQKDTRKEGKFVGEFTIIFNDNGDILRLPTKRELIINII